MIHYHGLPITPATAAAEVLTGRHAFVSFLAKDQIEIALEVCQSFAVDNGAFSAWKSGKQIWWPDYFDWVRSIKNHPNFDFAVIPDVIDGDELANDKLLSEWPTALRRHGAPVWHMHESIDRLVRLAEHFPRVCIGSSGEFARVGDGKWWVRMAQALDAICVDGLPCCKLHGLRMLDPAIFSRLPLASADSTNIAQNIGIDNNWRGTYTPPDKAWRARVMAARIESHNSAQRWLGLSDQSEFDLS